MILDWSREIDDFSRDELPGSPTESLGTRKLAIAPNALGEGAETVSVSRPVCPKTFCIARSNYSPFFKKDT
jgi:hypothetical protein